jgi:hypothetical protein
LNPIQPIAAEMKLRQQMDKPAAACITADVGVPQGGAIEQLTSTFREQA